MIKKLILVICIVVGTVGFSFGGQEFTLNLTNSSKEKFKVSLSGLENLWQTKEWLTSDDKGFLSIKRETDQPQVITISVSNWSSFQCYLSKGDVLNVSYNKGQFIIDGQSLVAKQNIFLQEIAVDRTKILDAVKKQRSTIKRNGGTTEMINAETYKTFEMHFSKVQEMISQFKNETSGALPSFLHFVELDNKYFLIKNGVNMPNYTEKTYHPFTSSELKQMSSSLGDTEYNEALFSLYYRQVLNAYVDYLRINDPEKKLGKGTDYLMNEVRLGNYAKNPLFKQYIAAVNLIGLSYYETNNPDFIKVIKEHTGIWSPLLINYVNSIKSKGKIKEKSAEFPEILGKDAKGNTLKLSDFRGKWLYIDIWATWCGPCKYEIPFLAKMKKKFEGLPVVFLGISVDKKSEEGNWKKMLIEMDMKGMQMIADNMSEVYSQFAIGGIPHFAIIDPQGKLFINGAPRASSGVSDRLLRSLTEVKFK